MIRLKLIQGANMEYLGLREPEIYGSTTAAELDRMLMKEAKAHKFALEIAYTNIEGEAINQIFAADRAGIDGLLMNPAGFSHAGFALRDCLKSVSLPYVEIHMSNIDRRGFHSATAPAADGIVAGFGIDSYFIAIQAMLRLLARKKAETPAGSRTAAARRTPDRRGRLAGIPRRRP